MVRHVLDINDKESVPYFLWNEKTTLAEFQAILANKQEPDRPLYLARLLREGRVEDVWKFLRPRDVAQSWDEISPHLGHRRDFWSFLLDVWRRHDVL
jgi:hypothetical protein